MKTFPLVGEWITQEPIDIHFITFSLIEVHKEGDIKFNFIFPIFLSLYPCPSLLLFKILQTEILGLRNKGFQLFAANQVGFLLFLLLVVLGVGLCGGVSYSEDIYSESSKTWMSF